jgi:Reverse transcriptase (RNA-dependent DNA polymerase)
MSSYHANYNFEHIYIASESVSPVINSDLFDVSPVLLWARPLGTTPFKPLPYLSFRAVVISLLLLSGDVEQNPGPPAVPSLSRTVLNVGCLNAYSAVNKMALLHNAIDECELDMLAITETWIKQSHPAAIKQDLAPPGYTVIHVHRPGDGVHDRGGVAIVARTELHMKQLVLSRPYSSVELLAVNCTTVEGRLNVIVAYRPPRSADFFAELDDILEEVCTLPGRLLICGDFNCRSAIAFLELDSQLNSALIEHDLVQHVTSSTHRLGGLLDLIITPVKSPYEIAVETRDLGISDHSMVIASLSCAISRPACVSSLRRDFRTFDTDLFRTTLAASSVFTNPEAKTNDFARQLRDDVIATLDKIAPARKFTRRTGKQSRGWLNAEAISSRKARRRLERVYRSTKSDADRVAYRQACRVTNKLINTSRRNYIQDRLAKASGDSRQRWRIANELLHRKDTKPEVSTPTSSLDRCRIFINFFANKLVTIANKIDEHLNSLSLPVLPRIDFDEAVAFASFKHVSIADVHKIICACPTKCSPLDFIPITVVKSCSDIFSPLLARLANMSFSEGVFPDIFKVGQITPILKKPGLSVDDPSNYRPITNLSSFGKILERIAQSQLRSHITASPNIGPLQSAYRVFHSTETAMTRVVSDLLTKVDTGSPSVLLSLDISAAFDTLDHSLLLKRAEDVFGFTGCAQSWLASYLSGRSSYVSINNVCSDTVVHKSGVPQGSVLGPLLFSIFTTPVGKLISSFGLSYHQYADDTQLYTALNMSTVAGITTLSTCAGAVTRWHLENGLLLNPIKSEAIITGTRHQVKSVDRSSGLCVTGAIIPFVDKLKLLGVTLDSHLTFDQHVSDVVKSCNYHIRALRHIRPLIDHDTAVTLACSIVASRLDYCNSVLYGITKINTGKLQRVQNKLARVVCEASYESSATCLLRNLHWLPIPQRIEYKVASIVYSARCHHEPKYISELLTSYTPVRSLRSSNHNLLVVPSNVKTVTASRAFCVAAPKLWNLLPCTVTSAESYHVFKSRLKSHLFNIAFS